MEQVHCVYFVFPLNHLEKIGRSTAGNLKESGLPKICKTPDRKAARLLPKKNSYNPEEIFSANRTSIYHVEELCSPHHMKKKKPQVLKNYISDTSKYYLKFYDRIQKTREKRTNKKNSLESQKRNNPWRYSASNNSVFDINILAQSMYPPSSRQNISVL